MSFDEIFDPTAGVYFNFYNILFMLNKNCTYFCMHVLHLDLLINVLHVLTDARAYLKGKDRKNYELLQVRTYCCAYEPTAPT